MIGCWLLNVQWLLLHAYSGREQVHNKYNRYVDSKEAIWDDGRGNLDCHRKMRVYWIGIEILPCNRPPTDPSKSCCKVS